jgi:serine-type D-Ala-D-Ala carboxypeptidase/endopeptidase (penicillin-binding protein 4)
MKWHDQEADKIVYTATDSTENKLKIVWDINQKWHLEGTVRRKTDTLALAFANPNMRAQLVHNLCDSLRIKPNPTYNLFTNKGMKKIFGYQSAPISELVQVCNEQSNNLYAEAFLKIIAARAIPSGTAQNGADLRQAFLQQYSEKYGVNTDGTHLVDGCGMSRHNLLTARFLTDFLAATQKDSLIAAPFLASLPIAGETGTLKKWFQNQPAKGKIRAKTGTLSRVLAYSGFATNAKNETIAFSLIVNNFDAKLNAARFKLTTFLNVLVE